jgi:hypothetical protein
MGARRISTEFLKIIDPSPNDTISPRGYVVSEDCPRPGNYVRSKVRREGDRIGDLQRQIIELEEEIRRERIRQNQRDRGQPSRESTL